MVRHVIMVGQVIMGAGTQFIDVGRFCGRAGV